MANNKGFSQMKELDEATALSILFSNTRRKKRNVDLLTIAKSCEYLVGLYGSQRAVADRIGISAEMIREFLTTLKLPASVQELVSSRRIDSIDIVRELSALSDSSKQSAAAEALVHTPSKDVRDIRRLIRGTEVSIEDAIKVVSVAKPKGLHIFLLDFDDETYKAIMKQSTLANTKPAELLRSIVTDWLKQVPKEEGKRDDVDGIAQSGIK